MAWDRKMTAVPSVGVAMSVYNQASIVGDAIESLLCQTQPPEQIVIVDDGSTDGSPEVIAGYEKFGVQLVGLERRGVSEVLNRGASLLETDYVAIQAADDRSLPDRLHLFLNRQLKHLFRISLWANFQLLLIPRLVQKLQSLVQILLNYFYQ